MSSRERLITRPIVRAESSAHDNGEPRGLGLANVATPSYGAKELDMKQITTQRTVYRRVSRRPRRAVPDARIRVLPGYQDRPNREGV
jgi:hypothetical protein